VASAPPGYQAMTVPVPPPGAVIPPSAAPSRGNAAADPAGGDAILGKDLSSRELGVLQSAASLKAAHARVQAGGASGPLSTPAPAWRHRRDSSPPLAPAAGPGGHVGGVDERRGEGRRRRQGGARGRDGGGGSYGAKELAAQVQRFEHKSLAAIAAGVCAALLNWRGANGLPAPLG